MTTPPPSDPPTQPELDDTGHATAGLGSDGPPEGWSDAGRGTAPAGVVAGAGRLAAPGTDALGTAALVLGIVGIVLAVGVLGGVLGVVALVFGILTLRRARRGEAPRGPALAGTILGAVAVLLSIAAAVVVLVAGIGPLTSTGSAGTAAAPARGQLQQCVQQAHGDRSAVKACRQQFGQPRRPGTAT